MEIQQNNLNYYNSKMKDIMTDKITLNLSKDISEEWFYNDFSELKENQKNEIFEEFQLYLHWTNKDKIFIHNITSILADSNWALLESDLRIIDFLRNIVKNDDTIKLKEIYNNTKKISEEQFNDIKESE